MAELSAETVGREVRAAYAASVRMIAVTLRSQAELLSAQAATLERTAGDIEDGRGEMPAGPLKLTLVPDGDELHDADVKDDADEDPGVVEEVMVGTVAGEEMLVLAVGDDEAAVHVSEKMAEWLGRFDDRIRLSPFFVAAVNEAADEELPLTAAAAQHVATVTRMKEQSAAERSRARAPMGPV